MSNHEHLEPRTGLEIAIIGMSGRFPGARNITEFWENLKNGVESITFFSDDELTANGVGAFELNHPDYVKAAAALEGIEYFDADFFGFNPKEAEIMDPQQRIFLETAWEALENAGYDPFSYQDPIGVYAGVSMNTYLRSFSSGIDFTDITNLYRVVMANEKDYLSSRVSYKFNLTGPSVVVQSACSTSLVAVHLGCRALLSGECNMALAGGVSAIVPQNRGYFFQEGGIFSPDGHCRAFDARAKGTIGGSGVGVVVLKRLEDALADRDYIHAIIRGTAINNDGSLKVGYSAPSVSGQAKVIEAAQIMAEVDPETISYIEAHGTGTPMGDPIEIAALKQVFQASTDKKRFCGVGSVKTNIGHLDVASGVTGLIKTVMALEHELIPNTIHFKQPNPEIDFANSPFFVCDTPLPWKKGATPRRAGVSSFGIGGTNAHAILEEAPLMEASAASRPYQLLLLSAKTESALEAANSNLVDYLRQHNELNLSDVAYTLQVGRRPFEHRRMVVCQNFDDAITALEERSHKRVFTGRTDTGAPPVAFAFSGQGAQYTNMGLSLYETEPVFKEQIDNCSELLKPHLGFDLRSVIYPSDILSENSKEQLNQTSITQPALFTLEYSLARLWMKWGIQPRAMIGHSIGEYVAACLAGVFTLEDGLALIAARGRLMQSMPAGAMLAVHLGEDEVLQLLNEDLCVAAVNGPSSCTISGLTPAIDELEERLEKSGVVQQRLRTSHAFHSKMMEPVVKQFIEAMSKVSLNAPTIPFISNVSGTWITEAEATDPGYWANHLRAAVRFGDGITELLKEPRRLLLEVGPGTTLRSLIKQNHKLVEGQQALASLSHQKSQESDSAALLNTLGKLWLAGAQVAWPGFYHQEQRQRLPLPSYPFQRQRYWVEPQEYAANNNQLARSAKRDVADWFYVPGWKRSLPTVIPDGEDWSEPNRCWLIFTDVCGLGSDVIKELQQQCQDVVTVAAGEQFAKINDDTYIINPRQRDDYFLLLEELRASDKSPNMIIHLWSVTGNDEGYTFEQYQEQGFYSLLWLAQAIGEKGIFDPVQLAVVSTNAQEVNGEEAVRPEKATVLGPCKVISKEYPNITCRSIDVSLGEPGTVQQQRIVEQIIGELRAKRPETIVAYRGKHRWVESFEPVRLADDGKERGRLREGGVYLITGGLGGIGFVLAEYLAKTVRAKLVLLGRTVLPELDELEQWQASDKGGDEVRCKMMKVRALADLGAEVLVVSADVTDRQQMQAAVREAYERFGEIHGVIHAAGVAGGGVIQLKTEEAAASVLAPKVKGALVLEDIFKDAKLDFLVLCSSILSVLSEFGQVDYCAANAFLDAFAHSTKSSTFTVSINWDIWREVGMGVNTAAPANLKRFHEEGLEDAILSAEGADAFRRILGFSSPQVIISVEDLLTRIERYKTFEAASLLEELEKSDTSQPAYPRPELANPYIAPGNGVEQIIAEVWQRVLGIKQVGIQDNFFELGGDSILGIQIVASVRRAGLHLTTQQLFQHQTVAELARMADSAAATQVEQSPAPSVIDHYANPRAGRDIPQDFSRVNISQSELEALFGKTDRESIEDIYPLTPLQQGMLFHILSAPKSGMYVDQQRYTLEGSLDISALKTAFQQVIDRHQILRTAFILASHGEPLQVVYRRMSIPWEQYDWRDQSPFAQQEKVEALLQADQEKDFDLSKAPMIRMALVQMREDYYEFIWSFHLMLLDGWSVPIVLKEVLTFYDALRRGQQIELEPPVLYGDYIDWLQQQDPSQAEAYWRKALLGFTMPTSLGGDRAPIETVDQQEDYSEESLLLDEATTTTLRSFTGQHQLTLNTLLQGAWALLLSRRSGADDIAFGSVVSGRPGDFPGVESTVGLFINTLPVRIRISPDVSLLPWLKALQTQQAEARRFEFCSLVDIQGWSEVPRGQPLFESVLIFQNTPNNVSLLDQDRLKVIDIRNRERINYPLTLVVEPASRLLLKVVYNHRRFDEGTITRMIKQVHRCLMEMVTDPEAALSSLSTKTEVERKSLIDSFNQSLEAY